VLVKLLAAPGATLARRDRGMSPAARQSVAPTGRAPEVAATMASAILVAAGLTWFLTRAVTSAG
jgi:hypothetical protein